MKLAASPGVARLGHLSYGGGVPKKKKLTGRGRYKVKSAEERESIIARVQIVGAAIASRESGVPLATIQGWLARLPPEVAIIDGLDEQVEGLIFRGWSRSRIVFRLATQHALDRDTVENVLRGIMDRIAADGANRLTVDLDTIRQEVRDRYSRLFEVAFQLGAVGRQRTDLEDDPEHPGQRRYKRAPPDPRFLRIALSTADRLAELEGVKQPDAGRTSVQVNLIGSLMRESPEFRDAVETVLCDDGGYRLLEVDTESISGPGSSKACGGNGRDEESEFH